MELDPVALITAVTGLATVIIGGLAYIFPKLNKLANSTKATDAWVLENQEKLRHTVQVVEQIKPEVKTELEKYGASGNQLTTDINLVKDELSAYYGGIPSSKTKDFPATADKDAV